MYPVPVCSQLVWGLQKSRWFRFTMSLVDACFYLLTVFLLLLLLSLLLLLPLLLSLSLLLYFSRLSHPLCDFFHQSPGITRWSTDLTLLLEKLLEVSNWWQVFRYTHTTYSSGHQKAFSSKSLTFACLISKESSKPSNLSLGKARKSRQTSTNAWMKWWPFVACLVVASDLGGLMGFYIVFFWNKPWNLCWGFWPDRGDVSSYISLLGFQGCIGAQKKSPQSWWFKPWPFWDDYI